MAMVTRVVAVGAGLAIAGVVAWQSSCAYNPKVVDCVLTCQSDIDCAGGQICDISGMCTTPGGGGHCGNGNGADGALPIDAREPRDGATPVDAAMHPDGKPHADAPEHADAPPPPDGPPPPPDGPPPPPPDAPPPPTFTVHVMVKGPGTVTAGSQSCTMDCMFPVAAGSSIRARRIAEWARQGLPDVGRRVLRHAAELHPDTHHERRRAGAVRQRRRGGWSVTRAWLAPLAVAFAVAGCYDPIVRDCTVTCAGSGDCEHGQACSGGYCVAVGEPAATCSHGEKPDASGASPVALHVVVMGSGRVEVDAALSCTDDCMFQVAAGVTHELVASRTGTRSSRSGPARAAAAARPARCARRDADDVGRERRRQVRRRLALDADTRPSGVGMHTESHAAATSSWNARIARAAIGVLEQLAEQVRVVAEHEAARAQVRDRPLRRSES